MITILCCFGMAISFLLSVGSQLTVFIGQLMWQEHEETKLSACIFMLTGIICTFVFAIIFVKLLDIIKFYN